MFEDVISIFSKAVPSALNCVKVTPELEFLIGIKVFAMLSTMKRELKDTIGDQLRGFRHLVRALGSEAPEIRVANQALPPLPPEFNRLVSSAFQTVDDVMGTLQTITRPFRSNRPALLGFDRFEDYLDGTRPRPDADQALTDDMYAALKGIARDQDPNNLILKARVADVSRKLIRTAASEKWTSNDLGTCCATLFLLLVKARPLAENDSEDIELWKTYAAVSLAFGLSVSGRLTTDEFLNFAKGDAILICSQRSAVFLGTVKAGTATEALIKTFDSLLRHLP